MSVSNDVIGAVIGKRGSKINEIRQLSKASINIMETGSRRSGGRDSSPDRERIIEISGNSHAVTMAKSMISMAIEMGVDGDGGRGGRRDRGDRGGQRFSRTRSRSRDRDNFGDRRGRRDKFAPY